MKRVQHAAYTHTGDTSDAGEQSEEPAYGAAEINTWAKVSAYRADVQWEQLVQVLCLGVCVIFVCIDCVHVLIVCVCLSCVHRSGKRMQCVLHVLYG